MMELGAVIRRFAPRGLPERAPGFMGRFSEARPGGPGDGVADGCHRRDEGHLADAADSQRVAGVWHFYDNGVNHGQVQRGGHPVVQER